MQKIKIEKNIHDFHIVMTKKMKKKIKKLSKNLNKSLSETAIHIIEKCLNFFKIHHFKSEESPEFSEYHNIFWKKHLHIYFNKTMYRKIKHLSDTHMAFSVAIVVRWIFDYYFDNIYDKKTKKENEIEIEKMDNEIELHEKQIRKWNKDILKKQLSGDFHYHLTFNEKFCLVGFNFISTS